MRQHSQPAWLQQLHSGAEELSVLFSIAKENFSEDLKKDSKRALGTFMGCSCQD